MHLSLHAHPHPQAFAMRPVSTHYSIAMCCMTCASIVREQQVSFASLTCRACSSAVLSLQLCISRMIAVSTTGRRVVYICRHLCVREQVIYKPRVGVRAIWCRGVMLQYTAVMWAVIASICNGGGTACQSD